MFAAKMNLKRDGHLKFSEQCKAIITKQEIIPEKSYVPYTSDDALGLVIEAKLTKSHTI